MEDPAAAARQELRTGQARPPPLAAPHRLASPSGPGSARRRPVFLRTIAPRRAAAAAAAALPEKFGALPPTLARARSAKRPPPNRKARRAPPRRAPIAAGAQGAVAG